MKTLDEIKALREDIVKSINAYHQAIGERLKESGKEFDVIGKQGHIGINLDVFDGEIVVDKVRWNAKKECAEYHSCEYNYQEDDTWSNTYWLKDDTTYVYDHIKW